MRRIPTRTGLFLTTSLLLTAAKANPNGLPDCPLPADYPFLACVTSGSPASSTAQRSGASIAAEGDRLTLRWHGSASAVRVEGNDGNYGFPLQQIGPDDWAVGLRLPALRGLSERFTFHIESSDGSVASETMLFQGPGVQADAAKQAQRQTVILPSRHLRADRRLTVWLPPGYSAGRRYPVIYVADNAAWLGDDLFDAMRAGRTPATLIVGIESDPENRYAEYIDRPAGIPMPGDPPRFAAHERFVIDEVMPWAESEYGAAQEAAQRSVAGYSNGADWAAAMALRHPDLFGRAIVMSPIMVSQYTIPDAPGARFDLSAGALEAPFALATACFAQGLHSKGADLKLRWWPHSHAPSQWRVAFAAALLELPADRIPDGNTCDMFRQGGQ